VGSTANDGSGTPGQAGTVLYLLSFLPTYVQWELEEISRRHIAVQAILGAPWPRSAMWDRVTGLDGAPPAAVRVRSLDFHRWLSTPMRSLASQARTVLAAPAARRAPFRRHLARSMAEGNLRHFLAAAWLKEALREELVRRIHSHFAGDTALIGLYLAELLDVPFSLTTHANDIFVPHDASRLRLLLKRAAAVVTISRFNRHYLQDLVAPHARRRIHAVHLGIDPSVLPPRRRLTGEFTIVCTASGLAEKKGVRYLVEACATLKGSGRRFRCMIVGSDVDGTALSALRDQLGRAGLGREVEALGLVPSRALLTLVARADVFVLPAIRTMTGEMDGIPVSLMEAMGLGVPVVSTPVSGIPELVESGKAGFLVPPGDAPALAKALDHIAGDRVSAEAVARRGRDRVMAEFTVSHSVDRLLGIWGLDHRPARTHQRAGSGSA
jgi:glycosyltransferase involved in cell wall biosynthesis